ncbi:MAG: YqhV family protein [Alicyclobacillaceae bacterium]|nr:YqhV family protein [Alicyclobacillaceae bacterium]
MAGLRLTSSMFELAGALLMLYFGTAARALQVNGLLALVGPLVLVSVTALGLWGVADDLEWSRIAWILLGVGCILFGARG